MTLKELSERIVKPLFQVLNQWRRPIFHYSSLLEFIKNLPSTIKEFKGAITILIIWLIVSEIAGYSIFRVFQSVIRIILYPLNWVLFKTRFEATGIPEVFLLLMPLVILLTVSFLVIIYTED